MATASPREAEAVFTIDHVDPVETIDAADVLEAADPIDPPPAAPVDPGEPSGEPADAYVTVWRTEADHAAVTADQRSVVSAEYAAAAGMPARGVVVVSLLATALCAAADCGLTGTLTMFFDLTFITVCLVGAMAIRRDDLFTAGVLAPLVFAVVVFAVAVGVGGAFVADGSTSTAFFTGLAAHAGALVVGYGVALAVVGGRVAARRSAHP
jgi:uncharacterized protein DUF6542